MKCKACRYQAQAFYFFHKILLSKDIPVTYQAEIRDLEELIFSPHCALNQFGTSKGPLSQALTLGTQGGTQEYRDESLSMPGLVSALQPVGSNTTVSSAVSALGGFEAAHRHVKVLASGEGTGRDVRKAMQASAHCCSCHSSNLSQLSTHQPAHILSSSEREVCN